MGQATSIRESYDAGRDGTLHVVRTGRRWCVVRQRDGQYRSDAWYSSATQRGLEYVATGAGVQTWPTLRALRAEVMVGTATLAELGRR